jgi:hypothetical protein
MNNPETMPTFGSRDTGQRQTKQNKQKQQHRKLNI